jgi:chorismate dehydratase
VPLRVAAIDFLNPAPLMWDFHHPPHASALAARYDLHLTAPAQCARELLAGRADLGLIPVAALTPELRIVPGCTIASLDRVRSIQLVLRSPLRLEDVRTVAADTASRSSVAYAQVLFRHFLGVDPEFRPAEADAEAMLGQCDAALLIGDPALLALERRAEIERRVGPCTWYDIAEQWRLRTGLPWVAAVWAVRPEAVPTEQDRGHLLADLNRSRDHGLAHIEDLVREWTPRIALPPPTIRHYLQRNIHYALDPACIEAIQTFRTLAARVGALPPLPELPFLVP